MGTLGVCSLCMTEGRDRTSVGNPTPASMHVAGGGGGIISPCIMVVWARFCQRGSKMHFESPALKISVPISHRHEGI